MFVKPTLKPHFHVEVLEPDTVFLLAENGHFALRGRLYVLLIPLLNGQHTIDEILQLLQEKEETSVLEICYALTSLEHKDYLTEASYVLPQAEAAFWSSLKVEPAIAAKRLQQTQVAVTTLGEVKLDSFIAALTSLNITVGDTEDLTIVLTDDYLQERLETFNQQALQSKKPWLLVKPVGLVIWVGPLFISGQTGCWECLAQRLRSNREVEMTVQQQKKITNTLPTSISALPTSTQIGINWAATEVAKWIVQREQSSLLAGKILTFDLASLSLKEHTIVQRPQCHACGDPLSLQKPKSIALQSYQKKFTTDGGHRCCSPEETLQKYAHLISPITGVVRALPKLARCNELIHVYGAFHSSGYISKDLKSLRAALYYQSAGKGKTDVQSKASGLCEGVERYSGIFTGDESRIKNTFTQLKSVAIHPNTCMNYSHYQYQNRHEWNKKHSDYSWIAMPFDEEREIEWTPVWSLTHHTFKYLPTAYCYYDYPMEEDHRFCMGDSNGNAAGNNLEEAILQGFMELIERDCVAIWWYNRLQYPAVNLDSFEEPYLQALKIYYASLSYDLWVLDITNDLNIPTFAAIARRTDQPDENILLGYGTHFDPKIALLRAVTELNQTFVMVDSDSVIDIEDPDFKYWFKYAKLENQPYLAPTSNISSKSYTDYPKIYNSDIKEDVLTCVDIMAQRGMETLVLDQTRPDIGLSVVKVIVPGLRHFWPRFAPGRLYEVPVQMGLLSAPLKEEQLNPVPMFF